MAPLLDTNHELNWHANMVDAIEQKAANQRAEGQSVPSYACSTSYYTALEGYHRACVDVHHAKTRQRHLIGGMLSTVGCLPLASSASSQSTAHLMHYTVDTLWQTTYMIDSQPDETADAFGLQFAQAMWLS